MSRADPREVRRILETDVKDVDVQAFIEDAGLVVDEFAGDLDGDGARSKAVEKWFAAELVQAREARRVSASGAGTRIDYQRKDAGDFFQSDYGEKADRLSGGLLREALRKEGAGMDWQIGTYG